MSTEDTEASKLVAIRRGAQALLTFALATDGSRWSGDMHALRQHLHAIEDLFAQAEDDDAAVRAGVMPDPMPQRFERSPIDTRLPRTWYSPGRWGSLITCTGPTTSR